MLKKFYVVGVFLGILCFTQPAESITDWVKSFFREPEEEPTPKVETTEIWGEVNVANPICTEKESFVGPILSVMKSDNMRIEQEIEYEECIPPECRNRDQTINRRACPEAYYQEHLSPSIDESETGDLDPSIDPRCTYRALALSLRKSHRYLNCSSLDDRNPDVSRMPPCVSKRLHYSVHQALTEISSCFQIDPKALFSLLLNEGGLHPLRQNDSGATGPGQLTGIFIREHSDNNNLPFVYDVYKEEVFPLLPRCRAVQDQIEDFKKLKDKPMCQRTNYYINILYSAMGYVHSIQRLVPTIMRQTDRGYELSRQTAFEPAIRHYEQALASGSRNKGVLRRKAEIFKNLALFQTMTQNDQNLIYEVADYAHNAPTAIIHLFDTYQRTLGLDPDNFPNFSGGDGYWVNFLRRHRGKISQKTPRQNEVLRHVYGGKSGRGSRQLAKGQMLVVEEGDGEEDSEIECRPY